MRRILGKVTLAFVATCVVAIADAGTVTGTVKFEGEPPKLKPIDMKADPACAAMHGDTPPANEVLVLGEGQTMGNVLVFVSKGAPEGTTPPPAEPVQLTQHGCQFSPRVVVVQLGQTLKVLNPDGILHNVHTMPKENTPSNRAMPKNVTEYEMNFTKAEAPFEIKCDIHPWMHAFCAVLTHPFHSVTAKDGVFKIEGLPAGEYEISAWHERLGTQTATVKVADDAPATQDFSFSRPAAGN